MKSKQDILKERKMFLTDENAKIEITKISTKYTRNNFQFPSFVISCFEYFNFLISQFRVLWSEASMT